MRARLSPERNHPMIRWQPAHRVVRSSTDSVAPNLGVATVMDLEFRGVRTAATAEAVALERLAAELRPTRRAQVLLVRGPGRRADGGEADVGGIANLRSPRAMPIGRPEANGRRSGKSVSWSSARGIELRGKALDTAGELRALLVKSLGPCRIGWRQAADT
jgi:hypothetical protein